MLINMFKQIIVLAKLSNYLVVNLKYTDRYLCFYQFSIMHAFKDKSFLIRFGRNTRIDENLVTCSDS